jgi:hypothetical protein
MDEAGEGGTLEAHLEVAEDTVIVRAIVDSTMDPEVQKAIIKTGAGVMANPVKSAGATEDEGGCNGISEKHA